MIINYIIPGLVIRAMLLLFDYFKKNETVTLNALPTRNENGVPLFPGWAKTDQQSKTGILIPYALPRRQIRLPVLLCPKGHLLRHSVLFHSRYA